MDDDELKDRSYNRLIDTYLLTGTMNSEAYAKLSPLQKSVVQVLKRAFKRINNPDEND